MNKKWLIRAFVAVAVGVASLLIAVPVLAPWDWCETDPILSVNGHTVNLDAAIEGDPAALAEGVVFHVNVPAGTQLTVLSCDPSAILKVNYNNGSGNQGINVSVEFNTDQTFAANVSVVVDNVLVNQATGTTQDELAFRFSVN